MRLETTNPVTMRGKYSKQKETTIRIKSRRVRLLLGHAGDIHGRVRLCNIFVGQGKSTIHQLNVSFVFYLFVFIYLFFTGRKGGRRTQNGGDRQRQKMVAGQARREGCSRGGLVSTGRVLTRLLRGTGI